MSKYLSDAYERAKNRFASFHEVRKNYDALLERSTKIQLQPELADIGEGIEYLSPDLEKALGDYVDVLKMNPTAFDVIPWQNNATANKDARDILYWIGRGWEHENKGRWWDRKAGEGQVRHGCAIMRLCWRPVTSEDIDADVQSPKEVLEVHEKAQKHRKHPFYWENCSIYNCYWVGDDQDSEHGADIFFYQYKLPYLEAQERFARDNDADESRPSLNELGKVAWLAMGEEQDSDQWAAEEVTVTVVDCRDLKGRKCYLDGCMHKQRVIRIYMAANDDQCLDEDNLVSEVDSPFPRCSFFVIGGRIHSGDDPNLVYRPLMHPLYVETNWTNYLTTLQAVEVRADYADSGSYINVGSSNPDVIQKFFEDNAQEHVVKLSHDPNELPLMPGPVERMPRTVSPHLTTLRAEHMERLMRYMPNRFMIGEAAKEASNATGSAFLQQAQQAALPFNTLLGESDTAIEEAVRCKIHAVKWWPVDEDWYAVMTGSQEFVAYQGSAPQRGHVACVNKDKLDMDFDIRIRTRSVTTAEESAEWVQAQSMYHEGALSVDNLIKSTGEDDIEGAKMKLAQDWFTAVQQPQFEILMKNMGYRYFYARTGFDMQNLGMPPVEAQAGGGAPQARPREAMSQTLPANNTFGRVAPQPTINLPPGVSTQNGISGGGSPTG